MIDITVLCENTTFDHRLCAEHGWSVLIRNDGISYLFDAGAGKTISGNAEALGVDLSGVSGVMLSHGHYDHALGLSVILDRLKEPSIYAHPSTFEAKYSLHGEAVVPIGSEMLLEKIGRDSLIISSEVQKIAPGMFLSGEIPRRFHQSSDIYYCDPECTTQDLILDDQFLVFDLTDGIVIILGCCHSGIRNSLAHAGNLFPGKPIKMLMGGMHLKNADPIAINDVVEALREYDPQRIAMAHCSGIDAYAIVREHFPGRMMWASAGTEIVFE